VTRERRSAYLAIDLGAESGRAIVGALDRGRLEIHELHRFGNRPQRMPTGLHWDVLGLWREVLEGARKAVAWAAENSRALRSIGVDTWGVDFALLGRSGELLGTPHCYRDARNAAAFEKTIAAIGRAAIYDATGIQFMALNTLYQLVAWRDADAQILERADKLLFMPDVMHYLLTGRAVNEATIASTSQMIDARTGRWATALLERLCLPTQMLGQIVSPGTRLGTLRADVAADIGADHRLEVIAPASHDTASAVAAVPAERGTDWCFLSSGTWSLLGAELDEPCLTAAARDAPFTNEGGVGGTTRFLKNIAGLWLVQECRREFAARGEECDYDRLIASAQAAPPFCTLIDPDQPPLGAPGRMLEKIAELARATDQPAPREIGQFMRCCLESLALSYRRTLRQLEAVLGRTFNVLHIVGGGARNTLLNQMTADAIDRRVVVGPPEATALGNILVQALGDGALRDRFEIRRVVSDSVRPTIYEPHDPEAWNRADARYSEMLAAGKQ
jgi:rhamnulokinase